MKPERTSGPPYDKNRLRRCRNSSYGGPSAQGFRPAREDWILACARMTIHSKSPLERGFRGVFLPRPRGFNQPPQKHYQYQSRCVCALVNKRTNPMNSECHGSRSHRFRNHHRFYYPNAKIHKTNPFACSVRGVRRRALRSLGADEGVCRPQEMES